MVELIIKIKTRRTFKMAVTINDIFVTMMNQLQYDEFVLGYELGEKSREELEAIYVASNMRPGSVIPLETPEMENQLVTAREFVHHWLPSVLPTRMGELAMRALLTKLN